MFDFTTVFIIFVLVFGASFLSGMLGVAGGLVLMGGLLYVLPVAETMIVHGLAQFVSNASRVYLWRRYLDTAIIKRSLLGIGISLIPFLFLRYVPSKQVVFFFLGASTLILLFLPEGWVPKITQRGVAFLCGAFSTALQFMAGVSGTFIDQFFLSSGLDRRSIVATKAVIQTVLHLLKVIYFGALGTAVLDGAAATTLLAAIPIIAVSGVYVAGLVLERMTDLSFTQWTRSVLFIVGSYYLIEWAVL